MIHLPRSIILRCIVVVAGAFALAVLLSAHHPRRAEALGLAPVTGAVQHVAAPVTKTVSPVAAPATRTVQHATAPATAPVQALATAPVNTTVQKVTAPVTNTVTHVAAPVTQTVQQVTAPVAQTIAPITNAVIAPTITPIVKTVQPIITPVTKTVAPIVTAAMPPEHDADDPVAIADDRSERHVAERNNCISRADNPEHAVAADTNIELRAARAERHVAERNNCISRAGNTQRAHAGPHTPRDNDHRLVVGTVAVALVRGRPRSIPCCRRCGLPDGPAPPTVEDRPAIVAVRITPRVPWLTPRLPTQPVIQNNSL